MKLTLIILVFALVQVSASTFAQKVTLKQKAIKIENVFEQFSRQSGYEVLCDADLIRSSDIRDVDFKHASVEDVMKAFFPDKNFGITLRDRTIIIEVKKVSMMDRLKHILQQRNISGKVIDESGLPMPGVTVIIPQASAGPQALKMVLTNGNGEFYINAGPTDSIQFSSIGYVTRKFIVSALPDPVVITMKTSVGKLDQVQVVGYGITSKRYSVGNATSIKAVEIEKEPVGNILLALQGKVPGLTIVQTTGIPGSAPTVKIRGTTSITSGTGTAPLYILDGIPIPDVQAVSNNITLGSNGISALEGINTADIESVDVLKDADATAIYGSRGANGVILITTKKGRAGTLVVNFNTSTGFSKVPHFIDLLDVHQYNAMRREALKNNNITPTAANSPDLFTYDTTQVHNWQKEYLGGTAAAQDANVSLSGGSGGTTVYANAGYHNQGSVFPGESRDYRRSFRMNVNHVSANGKLTLGLISGYSVSTIVGQNADLTSSIFASPSYQLYQADGTPNWNGANGFPLAYTMQPFKSETSTYNGHATVGYQLIKGLVLKLDAGYNNMVNAQRQTEPLSSYNPADYTSGDLKTADSKANTWIAEPQLTYNLHLNKHRFNFLLGSSFQKSTTTLAQAVGTNYASDALINNIGSAGTVTYQSSDSKYAYTSLFGRVTYDYNERYLANVSYRRDGSSRFGPDKRFGNFYALGLGWVFSKEAFIQDHFSFLSFGKLRGSYGLVGNDQIGDYRYLATYTPSTATTGYQGVALIPNGITNPYFRWEENRKLEFGSELGFFKDRLLLGASFFRNRSSNQLINFALPPQTGNNSYITNFPAIVQNQGWELEMTSTNIDSKNFGWKTSANIAFSHNKLVEFKGIENTSYASQYIVGQPLTIIKGYEFTGLSNTGIPTYRDITGNGTVDFNDTKVLGNKDPFTGGIGNDLRFKHFQLSFFIDYSRFNSYSPTILGVNGNLGGNRSTAVLSRWQNPGDELTTSIPRFTTTTGTYNFRNFQQSDINFFKANIFRLRNIVLNYDLSTRLIQKIGLRNARLFFQAQNVYTFGKRSDLLDPETGNSVLPPLRTLIFGTNFTF